MKFKLQLCVCVRASTHAGGGGGAGSDTSATWFTPQDIWQNWAIWLCMPGFPATRSCGPVQEATAQGGDEIGFWFYSRKVTEWNWSCDRKKHLLLTKLNWGWGYLMISSQSPYIHLLWGNAKQNQTKLMKYHWQQMLLTSLAGISTGQPVPSLLVVLLDITANINVWP